MNTLELTHKLFEMASDQTTCAMNYCIAIINAIICQYLTKAEYMEENAIVTFKGFLENGILNW